jgi:hypothetical protein
MMYLRKAKERGHANYGWLDTYHTFSFSDYYDPKHMGFGPLRVINEDRVAAGAGFPTHPHRDMEIITYVISGALAHKDSMGTSSTIYPGEIQKMSAGTGIRHSEYSDSDKETHLLQIWIMPDKEGIEPNYGQQKIDWGKDKHLALLASKDGREGSIKIQQETDLFGAKWEKGHELKFKVDSKRLVWIQMVKGDVTVNGQQIQNGDGLAIAEESELVLKANAESEFLLFDLPH